MTVSEDRIYLVTNTTRSNVDDFRVEAFRHDGRLVPNEGFAVTGLEGQSISFEGGLTYGARASGLRSLFLFTSTTALNEYRLSSQPIRDWSLRRISGVGTCLLYTSPSPRDS